MQVVVIAPDLRPSPLAGAYDAAVRMLASLAVLEILDRPGTVPAHPISLHTGARGGLHDSDAAGHHHLELGAA